MSHCKLPKRKRKELKEPFLKEIVPHWFDGWISEIQAEYHKQTTQLEQSIRDQDNRIQAIQYENVVLQGKTGTKDQGIAALLQEATHL